MKLACRSALVLTVLSLQPRAGAPVLECSRDMWSKDVRSMEAERSTAAIVALGSSEDQHAIAFARGAPGRDREVRWETRRPAAGLTGLALGLVGLWGLGSLAVGVLWAITGWVLGRVRFD